MALSPWPPIICQAYVNSLRSRVSPKISPGITAYHISKHILADVFGEDWVWEHVLTSKKSSFLLNNWQNDKELAKHILRVIGLAEMIWNSQWIPGFAGCISQLKTGEMIEPTYAELDIARDLIVHLVPFRFNERSMQKGEDFDLLVTYPNGMEACADTKCKLERRKYSQKTVINSLDDARKRTCHRIDPV